MGFSFRDDAADPVDRETEERRCTRARPDESGEGLETEMVGLLLKSGAGLIDVLIGVISSECELTGSVSSGVVDGLSSFGGGVGGFDKVSGGVAMGWLTLAGLVSSGTVSCCLGDVAGES